MIQQPENGKADRKAEGEGSVREGRQLHQMQVDEHFTRKLTTFLPDECSDQLYRKFYKMKQPLTLNYFYIKIAGNASSTTKTL